MEHILLTVFLLGLGAAPLAANSFSRSVVMFLLASGDRSLIDVVAHKLASYTNARGAAVRGWWRTALAGRE
jgi:hypothetical protein